MQAIKQRIFIHEAAGGFEIVCRIPHDMSPENYLTQVTFQHNEHIQAQFLLGRHVSSNPVIGTLFNSLEAGHTITVSWQDVSGRTGSISRTFDGRTD